MKKNVLIILLSMLCFGRSEAQTKSTSLMKIDYKSLV
jgi:hypothetical protein